MTLHLLCSSSSPYLFHLSKLPPKTYSHFLLRTHHPPFMIIPPPSFISRASSSSSSRETDNGVVHYSNSDAVDVVSLLQDESLLNRVSAAEDADEALDIVAEVASTSSGTVSVPDCCSIITAAIDRNNAHLALSVFYAMRSSFDHGVGDIERWKWSRPNVSVYTTLVLRLAGSLKVSDALKTIDYICSSWSLT